MMKHKTALFLGALLGLTHFSALSADSVIKISGRVLDYGCSVSSDSINFTVDLLKHGTKQFPNAGSTSQAVPFQIKLTDCSSGTTGVRVAFSGVEDTTNNALLKLDSGNDAASGLGIEILDSQMQPMTLNAPHSELKWITVIPEKDNVLPYSARLMATQTPVHPGLVNAAATFTLEFQ